MQFTPPLIFYFAFLLLCFFYFIIFLIEHLTENYDEYSKDGSTLPTTDELSDARSAFDPSNEMHRKCFKILTEVLVPAVTSPTVWTEEVRRKQIMSAKGTVKGKPDQTFVSPSDMGFLLTLYENINEKALADWKSTLKQRGSKSKIKAKFTLPNSGSRENGGWAQEGRDCFSKYTDLEIKARGNKEALASEQSALDWYVLL